MPGTLSHLLVLSTKLSNHQKAGVITDHMSSTIAVADQTEAKMAAPLAEKNGRV